MDLRESLKDSPDLEPGLSDRQDTKLDSWVGYPTMLEGPRRTYHLLLERLEQSRVLLHDLSARLRGS